MAGTIEVLGEKPVTVPPCPPQIPHALGWVRTRASAVRSRGLTARVTALPKPEAHNHIHTHSYLTVNNAAPLQRLFLVTVITKTSTVTMF